MIGVTAFGIGVTALGVEVTALGVEVTALGVEVTALGVEVTALGVGGPTGLFHFSSPVVGVVGVAMFPSPFCLEREESARVGVGGGE